MYCSLCCSRSSASLFHGAHLQSMMAMLVHHMRHAAISQRGNSDAWSKAWAAAKVSVLLVQDVQQGMAMS